MNNPFEPPKTEVADIAADVQNNSGGGSAIIVPDGVKGWSWGAFFWNWIWAIFNRTWIGLLSIIPYIGIIPAFYLGFKGRELAWKNKRWDSLEHFNRVQRAWSRWAVIIFVGMAGVGMLAAIVLPAYQDYSLKAKSGA